MRALVTGIHGFAAGHLVEHLLAAGDDVLGTVRRPDVLTWSASVSTIEWDLTKTIDSRARHTIEAFAPDCIFHLAALSVPSECGEFEPNTAALAVNVEGTRHVVELCLSLPHSPRLLLVSSSKVYAPIADRPQLVDETAPLGPASGYGKSKFAAEFVVRSAAERGLKAVIARPFQHSGPGQKPPLMLADWAQQFACPDTPVRVQRLNAYLDFSDVRDIVRAYRLLGEVGQPGADYNIGSGRALRSGEVLDELRRIADPSRPIIEDCSQPQYHPLADTTRLRAATGWQPAIDWRQTVADTWKCCKQQQLIHATRTCR